MRTRPKNERATWQSRTADVRDGSARTVERVQLLQTANGAQTLSEPRVSGNEKMERKKMLIACLLCRKLACIWSVSADTSCAQNLQREWAASARSAPRTGDGSKRCVVAAVSVASKVELVDDARKVTRQHSHERRRDASALCENGAQQLQN